MNHETKVRDVCEQVKFLSDRKSPVKILKNSVSHFVPNPYDKREKLPKVNISKLDQIINIDTKNRLCTAETGVTFADLVKETLKHGLIPYTVPELKTITIGGAISGCSIESMSYKYGGFHDSCTEYEIVTAQGICLTCSPEMNSEIFHMIHGSYGTVGILTKATFKLHPAKNFVHMKYVKHDNFTDFWNFLKERTVRGDYDFVDAIIHGPSEFVVSLGQMVDSVPYTSSYDWLKIFYKSTRKKTEDYLTIFDYFFRYDTECHWITKSIPGLESLPMRFLFGKLYLGSTNMIKWSKKLNPLMKLKKRPDVVVDVFIPEKRFEDFFSWYKNEYKFYPLWIVPYKAPKMYPWINDKYAEKLGEGLFIDCAVYGKRNNLKNVDYSETLERKTVELGGIKTLISRNHFDEKTFWTVYNKKNYDAVKSITDPKNLFNNLYTKFAPKNYV